MTQQLTRIIGALSVAALLLTGCASNTEDVAGVWSAAEGEAPQLELHEGGEYTGNDGCNTVNGTWEHAGDDIEFSDGVSTLKACPDVDVWMEGFTSGTVSGDTMTLFDGEGVELGSLTREG